MELSELADISDETVELLAGAPAEKPVPGEHGLELVEQQRAREELQRTDRRQLDESLGVAASDRR
jgi:hypothetical protein